MVDTNSDPRQVDYVIPANDDASKSIDKVLSFVTDAVAEGLSDRKADKEKVKETKEVAAPETEEVAPKAEETKEVAPKKKEAKAPKAKAVKVKETKVKEIKAEDTETPAEEKK